MAVTPDTILYLIKSPIELDNLNQLTFNTKEAQETYFLSLPRLEINKITYQRKDNVIRFPAHIDSIIEYNYVMYQNKNYGNKWFYAFITNMEYANDGMTLITIKTDVYQTWMFDIDIKTSFVVREHTNNDTVGNNTVPEGLEKGTMIDVNFHDIGLWSHDSNGSPNNYVIVLGSTVDLKYTSFPKLYGCILGGLYSGVRYYAFRSQSDVSLVLHTINESTQANIEDIVSIFMAPSDLAVAGSATWWTVPVGSQEYKVHEIDSTDIADFENVEKYFSKPTSIDGYTPINKKLLTGEFNSLILTNYSGATQNYRYEYFSGSTCIFYYTGVISPGCSMMCIPENYLVNTATQDSVKFANYGIELPKIPICNWNSDQYTAWLAATTHQRAANIATGIGSAVAGTALIAAGLTASLGSAGMATPIGGGLISAGTATMTGAGITAGGLNSILSTAAQLADHEKDANANYGTLTQADDNYVNSRTIGAYQHCIRSEYAQKIDKIFSVTGYATNTMKIPNVTGRRNWNYVQTQAVAIQGTIPQEDLQEIKNMFNNGVTFWHNPATFLDYSQNNDII